MLQFRHLRFEDVSRVFWSILNKIETKPNSNNGRDLTDASLKYERDKTDASLISARKSTETHIDNGLVDERESADHTLQSRRIESDDLAESKRKAPGYNLEAERRDADQRITFERKQSDAAIETERELVDQASARERALKTTIESRLLSSERGRTDHNLSAERVETDSAFKGAVNSLKKERSGHLLTKTSLTTRDEFLAIVSHDLRNPLGAASSSASMLLEDFEHPPEVRKWLEFIRRNVDTSLRMISDLLDVERIAENKMEMNLSAHPINPIVREACETFVLAAKTKDIEFEINCSEVEIEADCDPDRITQVLFNLLSNALKFTPAHGKISVAIERHDDALRISVCDTGSGMPENKMSKIFDRYAQLPSKDRSGLGLGLYIAKSIVEAHGSDLKVESTELVGTTISFALRMAD